MQYFKTLDMCDLHPKISFIVIKDFQCFHTTKIYKKNAQISLWYHLNNWFIFHFSLVLGTDYSMIMSLKQRKGNFKTRMKLNWKKYKQ